MTDFLYATCLVGAEKLLKDEVARTRPELRPAFMRPGFITFKAEGTRAPLRGTFAQASGLSLGKDSPEARRLLPKGPFGLMVYGPEVDPEASWALLPELRAELGATPLAELRAGAPIVDVVLLPEQRFLGRHDYDPQDRLHPGVYRPQLPEEAPSRAWLKLEEALALSRVELRAADRALELGSAPGGAAWALLSRGLAVTGVDPAKMDPRILQHPRYRHLERSINLLREAEIPEADWIFSDMNIPPEQTLKHALALAERRHPLGLYLTLKLKDQRAASFLPRDAETLAAAGFTEVGLRQLPSHRQEVLLYGLSPAGLARRR